MQQSMWLMAAWISLTLLGSCAGVAWSQEDCPLDPDRIRPVASGERPQYDGATVSVAGKVLMGRLSWTIGSTEARRWVTFNIKGYDTFRGLVGVRDDVDGNEGSALIQVDGKQVLRQDIRKQEAAKPFEIPLTGCQTLTLRSSGWVAFFEPWLTKGKSASATGTLVTATPAGTDLGSTASKPPDTPAGFAVDPNDLDKLADGLRRAVDDQPPLKEKVDGGKTAIATFDLIDISSPSVARNVAEDLGTAMVEKRFRLVERGQLDKVLKELKIEDSGLISPATAKEIGKLTGCTLILVGSISDRGGFVVVNARLLETETGESVVAKRVEMRKILINRGP